MSDDELRYPVLRLMRRYGVPIRRDLYVHLNWMGSPPRDEDWTLEDVELPPELQDFTKFERPRRARRRRR
jgi:hypothetical protein